MEDDSVRGSVQLRRRRRRIQPQWSWLLIFLGLTCAASEPNTGAGDTAAATAAVTPGADLRLLFFAPGALEPEEPADEEPGGRVEYLMATTSAAAARTVSRVSVLCAEPILTVGAIRGDKESGSLDQG
ncbi:hypothetical protein DFH08DRAFT_865643 [Mycena albidolilacea]|uniref:Uncharacterized protein n=1 Tax=Mycena albidolilacea TaxID=1033008 RepID=A0AAD7A2G9_9AGAR|nr:hypothetical protein DFH08DRAFT_865643 [Mycena albidolilacea]